MNTPSHVNAISMKNDVIPIVRLAIPLIITGLVQSSLGFCETAFLAHLGEHAMAAGALVSWLFATLIVVIFGTFSSINVLVSHKHGAKDVIGISKVLRDGLIFAMLLAVPMMILFWNMSPILLLLGQSPKLVALAQSYLHGLAWGLLPKFIMIVLYEFIIGLGHARIIMIITMISVPLYLFLSYSLIFGQFGFPDIGIAGAGWGITIADWIISPALCIFILVSKEYRIYLSQVFNLENTSYIREIIQLGAPMGMMYCIEVGFFFAIALLMGLINIQSLAANQVTMQYLATLMGVIFCIAQAITVRMGHELGAKHIGAAVRASAIGIKMAAAFMFIIALMYWFMPDVLISVDFHINNPNNAETVQLARKFLFVAAFFQILEAIRIAMFGSLRGFKETKFALLTSIISFWCIALPIGYFLAIYLQFGGVGFWYGMIFGVICSVIMLILRLRWKIKTYIMS